jgi:hypothetical protein
LETTRAIERGIEGEGAAVVQNQAAFGGKVDPPERVPHPGPAREFQVVVDRTAGAGDLEVDRNEAGGGGAEGETLRRPQRVLRAL